MAANKKTSKAKAAKNAKPKAKRTEKAETSGAPQRRRSPEEAQSHDALLDEKSRRDISGVVFVVLAIVALLLAVLPSDALVSGFASAGVHLLFGIGCYILPVILLAIAGAFFWRWERRGDPARIAIGFSIMFVGLLAIFALFAPITVLGEDDPSLLFSESALVGYGGYIGSALAWVGLILFGRVITAVILVGVIIIGGVVIGFSISSAIEAMRRRAASVGDRALGLRHRNSASTGGFARVRQQADQSPYDAYDGDVMAFLEAEAAREGFDPDNTAVLGMGAGYRVVGQDEYAGQLDPDAFAQQPDGAPYEGAYGQPYDPASSAAPPETAAQGRVSRRLSVPDEGIDGALTRRLGDPHDDEAPYDDAPATVVPAASGGLVPIMHSGISGSFDDDGYDDYDEDDEPYASIDSVDEAPFELIEEPSRGSSNPRKKDRGKGSASKKVVAADIPAVDDVKDAPGAADGGQGGFELPPLRLLNKPGRKGGQAKGSLEATAAALGRVLADFGIDARVVQWIAGPTVTLFEVDLPAGVRVSRVTALSDDIALALASPGVRIFAPVPGTNYVGIEVPNAKRETVLLSEVLEDAPEGPLQIAIGKDVEGNSIVSDLARMPHLLIGGTTGSGKSVSINGMIMSILMRATPDEVRFIMIDPKRVEFTPYNGIPHLYVPVVTEPAEAASALAWGVAEMERRLKVFSKIGARNIAQYNAKADEQRARIEAAEGEDGEDALGPDEDTLERLPYIVIIIDELADLMMNIGKEVEMSISRIAQLARAAGIHLIVATQRPSTNVVTGLIKANITNRIAFNVASGIDSRVILDNVGAESLIGLGDLLLSKPELARPQRIQGCFVTEDEINKVVDFVKQQGEPEYHGEILSTNVVTLGASSPAGGDALGDRDPLVWEAAELVVSSGMGSTSNIQRRLKVGYARAGRIMDQLEEIGVVGPANGSKPRDVLLDEIELESVKAFEMSD